jgi:hypothetical protein
MGMIYERVAGLDVPKKPGVACRRGVTADKRIEWETKSFGTMTGDLLRLHAWLSEWEVKQEALESRADYIR